MAIEVPGAQRVRGLRRWAQEHPEGHLVRLLLAQETEGVDPNADLKRARTAARQAAVYRRATGRTVDVGPSTGAMLAAYTMPRLDGRPPVAELVGVEPLPPLLRRAVQRAQSIPGLPPFHALVGWPERLPLQSGVVDTVLFDAALCGTPDPGEALREAARVLAPEGRVLIFEHVRPEGVWGPVTDTADTLVSRLSCRLNNRTPDLAQAAGLAPVWEERWMGGAYWAAELRRA